MANESQYVNGMQVSGIYTEDEKSVRDFLSDIHMYETYDKLLENSDAVYIISSPQRHYHDIRICFGTWENSDAV